MSLRMKLQSFLRENLIDPEGRNFLLGIFLLLVVVIEWTGSSFLTQGLFDGGYEKAFLVTYLNTSAFSLYLIPLAIKLFWQRLRETDEDSQYNYYDPLPTDVSIAAAGTHRSRSLSFLATPRLGPPVQEELPPLTVRETANLASVFCFFWFIANWTVNASLDYTSVASSTILSAMSGFFTLGIGRLFGVESFSLAKFGAVIMSFIGVLLVTLNDASRDTSLSTNSAQLSRRSGPSTSSPPHPADTNPPLGDFLAILSAFFYALYVTLLKVRIKSESRINMQLFFGFVGLINMLALWPLGVFLHYTGMEPLEWPANRDIWGVLLINMLITVSSDYIYLLAMLKTTPLIVTVGLSLTIPVAVVGDWMILGIGATPPVLVGAILVVLSFTALGFEGRQEADSTHGEGYTGVDDRLPPEEDEIVEAPRGRRSLDAEARIVDSTTPLRSDSSPMRRLGSSSRTRA